MRKISEITKSGIVLESYEELDESRVFIFKEGKRKFGLIIDDLITKEQAENIVNETKESIVNNSSLDSFEFEIKIIR